MMDRLLHRSAQAGTGDAAYGDLIARSTWSLRLLNQWRLDRDSRPVTVSPRQQRLIAALALRGARCRRYFAGLLWPLSTDAKASGSLRACIWSVTHQLPGLLAVDQDLLGLGPDVRVDHTELSSLLSQLDDRSSVAPQLYARLRDADLLPGWYDDWLSADQDRFRLLRVSALEAIARSALARGDLAMATDAAASAVVADPLRETAQRELLRAQLEAGNRALAVKAYEGYCRALERELGVRPSAIITDLIRPVLG